jgi:hypothetical protein
MRGWGGADRQAMTDQDAANLATLLQRFSTISRVVSSDQLIRVFAYKEYCLETYVFILQTWPWVHVSETIHRLLTHSWEVVVLNFNFGLKKAAEQGNESLHGVQRDTREHQARKVSLVLGDTDTFRWDPVSHVSELVVSDLVYIYTLIPRDMKTTFHRHGVASSSPEVRALDRKPFCSSCNSTGHWTRGCKLRYFGPHELEDDSLVQSFFCSKDSEPEDQKSLLDNM